MYAEMVAVCGSLRFYNLVKVNDKELLALKIRSQPVVYVYRAYATCWMVRSSYIGSGKRGFSSPKRPDGLLCPPSLLFSVHGVISWGA